VRIKTTSPKKNKFFFFNFFLKAYFIVTIIFISLFIILFFNTGYWKNYKDQFLNRLHTSSVINYIYLPEISSKIIRAKFYDVPNLNLNISFKNQLNLENQRKQALKVFSFGDERNNFNEVNASINYKNKKFKIDLRYKGDRKSHWFEKDRASYKLDLKKDKKILGMEKFSLQKPRMKNYIHEWLFYELIGELDLIKLNYMFVDLSINGSDSKLFALEEGFDKILIERNKKRNGPIFSLHEEFTKEIKKTKFEVYNKNLWLNKENLKFTQIARRKLENFFEDEAKNIDGFDIDKWAAFFAITDLNYYAHGRAVKSVKFFYNPVSGLIEPIGYDAHRSVPNYSKYIKDWNNLTVQYSYQEALTCKKNIKICINSSGRVNGNYLVYRFFFDKDGNLNEDFFKKYRKNVLRVTSKEFLDNFFLKREYQIKKINSLIYEDYFFVDHNYFYGPGLYYFSKKDIYTRAESLNNSFRSNIEKIFVEQKKNEIIIDNILNNNLGLTLNQIKCEDLLTKKKYIFSLNKNINKDFTYLKLSNLNSSLNLKCLNITFLNEKKIIFEKDIYQNLNQELNKFTKINKNSYKDYFNVIDNKIFLKKKNTIIDKSIIIPKNYIVFILPGSKITLKDNAFIYSNSAWNVNGKKEEITISGTKNNFGGGILITDKNNISIFKNVKISYLSGANQIINDDKGDFSVNFVKYNESKKNSFTNEIKKVEDDSILYNLNHTLYGALNFSNTEIILDNIYFNRICSEDVLNIISSKFLIENLYFEENCSDSIDIDFGEGSINNVNFKHVGNDAIDLSGSIAQIKNVVLEDVGDKLVSIGENSKVSIKNLIGENSYVGIASKDGSTATLQNIKMNNVKIGLAAYIKKDEYGSSTIIADEVFINDSKIKWITDEKSIIILNKKKINTMTKTILRIIYDKEEGLIN
jgi:hypothetical protein